VIDKSPGLTSHDVVVRVRGAIGGGRVGHAGTLDPFATGVLVLCLGTATRVAEWASGFDKRYLAEITLGVETDSYDSTGRVVASNSAPVDRGQVERALTRFIGDIEQRPPAFSAIQIDGRRMYDLARRGTSVVIAPRRITIAQLDLIAWDPPRATIDLTCSKGTYVRSLAHDLGEALGTGGHLSALRRTASGPFAIVEAHALDDAISAIRAGVGGPLLRPLDLAIEHLPRLQLDVEGVEDLSHGRPLKAWRDESANGPEARAYAPDGAFLAIVEWRDDAWWPRKVFLA
jgi:tRNA pseudouridine55 synthase